MMEMKLNSGKFVIDDNNKTIVDDSIKKEIEKGFDNIEENKDKKKPDLIIKD